MFALGLRKYNWFALSAPYDVCPLIEAFRYSLNLSLVLNWTGQLPTDFVGHLYELSVMYSSHYIQSARNHARSATNREVLRLMVSLMYSLPMFTGDAIEYGGWVEQI
jgi:hypothetical protein